VLPAPWCDVLEPICPADVDPAFAGPQFRAVAASEITQDGGPVLKVVRVNSSQAAAMTSFEDSSLT
jgi:hypothetical protein